MSLLHELPDPPEAGRAYLLRALAALPAHSPDAALWPRIGNQLDLPDQPAGPPPDRAAQFQLPQHEPDEAVWAAIAARLDAAPAPAPATAAAAPRPWWLRAAGRSRRRATLAAAALLLLLVGGLALWQPRPAAQLAGGPHETISYAEEVASAPPPAATSTALAADALSLQGQAFIDAHCSSLPAVCQSVRFRELREELTELDTEEARLADDLRRFGSQPELLRHQSHVTAQKATTTRALIQLLIS